MFPPYPEVGREPQIGDRAVGRCIRLFAQADGLAVSDALGVGVSWAKLTDADGPGFTTKSEAALELFYGFDLAPGVRVEPDLQYTVDPGGDASVDNAWILTMRVTLSL
jgi:carbohydrate-selective porin OprB